MFLGEIIIVLNKRLLLNVTVYSLYITFAVIQQSFHKLTLKVSVKVPINPV